VHLRRRRLYRRGVLDRGSQTGHRSPGKVTSPPTPQTPNAPGVALPRTQRPQQHPTPKKTTSTDRDANVRGASERRKETPREVPRSGDLVVVAASGHPTPKTPNALRADGTKPHRRPGVTLPSRQRSENPLSLPPATCHDPATCISLPANTSPSPRGDPAFRVEQEMKGRRPKRPPINQIRLPLQARAGNRPTN
jgi:hypothetical protein